MDVSCVSSCDASCVEPCVASCDASCVEPCVVSCERHMMHNESCLVRLIPCGLRTSAS